MVAYVPGLEKQKARSVTKTERTTFRLRLKAELTNSNSNREALAVETSADELDRIRQASARDSVLDRLERTSVRLREVRIALRRIDAGTFGVCAACEAAINPKRLAAIPGECRRA